MWKVDACVSEDRKIGNRDGPIEFHPVASLIQPAKKRTSTVDRGKVKIRRKKRDNGLVKLCQRRRLTFAKYWIFLSVLAVIFKWIILLGDWRLLCWWHGQDLFSHFRSLGNEIVLITRFPISWIFFNLLDSIWSQFDILIFLYGLFGYKNLIIIIPSAFFESFWI